MRRQASMDDVGATPRGAPGLARSSSGALGLARSSSGVWWKLGDAGAAADASSEVERRLRAIAEEEAAVRARVERRQAGVPAFRRRIAVTSVGLEVVALAYGLWTATRRRGSRNKKLLLLLPALAVPAMATLVFAAFARFRTALDARDRQQLERLRTEREAKIGSFRGSHHNLQKLIERYDPDAADSSNNDNDVAAAAATGKGNTQQLISRTRSRLSFHVGDADE